MNAFYDLFNLQQGEQEKDKVKEDVVSNISFRGANLWILACAIFIAAIGLNVNSTAVIIGAMLISPLMGPIVGSGFALATYDFSLLKRSGKNLLIATAVGLVVSCIYFFLSPFKDVQSELLARTSPTIYDVLIAFFGGIVGAISITRKEKGNPIPGVAIATALMPPLCTAGFGIATLNMKFVAGAMYLYSINCFFIAISTFLVIKLLKYKAVTTEDLKFDKQVRVTISVLLVVMIIPSFYLAYSLLQERKFTENVERFIQNKFTDQGYTVIYKNVTYNTKPKKIELAVLSKKIDSTTMNQLRNDLQLFGITETQLTIKQNYTDLKKEILSEIKLNQGLNTENELRNQQLLDQLNSLQIGTKELDKEIKILFPEVQQISFGVMTDYTQKEGSNRTNTVIYQSDQRVDEQKLQAWLQSKFDTDDFLVIQKR